MKRLTYHLWTLPRWFATPFFGASIVLGSLLGSGYISWWALIVGLCIMAGGHSFNSFLDYAWTGLDKGEVEDRSAEKCYTGGQNLLAAGKVSIYEVCGNAVAWYVVALALFFLFLPFTWQLLLLLTLGMLTTFWYSKSKFNWTHELALGVGVGPLSLLLGMYAVTSTPDVIRGIVASVPSAIVLSFAGLALDEYPDAEANLKKGVKSIAYKVWEYKVDLSTYIGLWLIILFTYHVFLISLNLLKPLSALAFLTVPLLMFMLVMLKGKFEKTVPPFIIIAAAYLILMVVGQAL